MRMILLAFALFLFSNTLLAQVHQGTVTIENKTDCQIAWDIFATCPPCDDYHTGMMNVVAPQTTMTYESPVSGGSNPQFPWEDDAPPCSNWYWSYAFVYIPDCNGVTWMIGNNCQGTIYQDYIPTSCSCNGHPVILEWVFVGNDVVLKIHY